MEVQGIPWWSEWLGLQAAKEESTSSVPGQGTKILEVEWRGKKKKENGGTEVWGQGSPNRGRGGTGGECELVCLPTGHTENFQDSSPCSETSKA